MYNKQENLYTSLSKNRDVKEKYFNSKYQIYNNGHNNYNLASACGPSGQGKETSTRRTCWRLWRFKPEFFRFNLTGLTRSPQSGRGITGVIHPEQVIIAEHLTSRPAYLLRPLFYIWYSNNSIFSLLPRDFFFEVYASALVYCTCHFYRNIVRW